MTLCCWRIFFPGGLPFGPLRRPGCGTCCSRCHCLGHLDADSERMGVHQRIRSSSGLMSLFVGQSPAFGKSAGIFGVFFGLVLFGSWSKSEVVVGDNRGRLFTYEGGNSAKWSFCSMSWGVGERSNWFSLHGSYFLRWNRKPYVGKIIGWFALPVFYWSHGIIQNHWNISTHKKRMVQECSRMFIYIYYVYIYIIY